MSDLKKLDASEVASRKKQVELLRAQHYASLLREWTGELARDDRDHKRSVSRLQTDWHNILDAHQWVVRNAPKTESVAAIAGELLEVPVAKFSQFLTPAQKVAWLEPLLLYEKRVVPRNLLAQRGNLANAYSDLGELQRAIDILEDVQRDAAARKLDEVEAHAIANLANLWASKGRLDQALEFQNQSLELQRRSGNKMAEAAVLNNIAHIYRRQSEYQTAKKYLLDAYEIFVELKDGRLQARVLGGLSTIARRLSDPSEALDYQIKRFALLEELGETEAEKLNAFSGIGLAQYELNDLKAAEASFLNALRIARELGNREGEASAIGNLGLVYAAREEYVKAYECHDQQLRIAEDIGDPLITGNALGGLGTCARHLGKTDEAIQLKCRQYKISRKIKDLRGQASALGGLSTLHLSRHELKKAWRLHQRSVELFRSIGDRAGHGRQLINGAQILVSEIKAGSALALLDEADLTLPVDDNLGIQAAKMLRQQILKDKQAI